MLKENVPARGQPDDPKLGFEVKSIAMLQRSREEIRATNPTNQIYAISKDTPEAKRIESPVKPVLNPTLLAVKDSSQEWASMKEEISEMRNEMASMRAMKTEMEAMKAEMKKVVPLANHQYLVLCSETARLVMDRLDQMVEALVGKRLENVDEELKSALLDGPFKRFKKDDGSSPKLCGSFSYLVKAIEDGNGEKFHAIVKKVASEFVKQNPEYTVEELLVETSHFPRLRTERDGASHHIRTDVKVDRAKLITDFVSDGGLKTHPSLEACSGLIKLGLKFLQEKPEKIKMTPLYHPVKKKRTQVVSITVDDPFVPGEHLRISGPVGWFGNGKLNRGPKMERNGDAGWRFSGSVGIPENGLPYGCELVKYYDWKKIYERGSKFVINPQVDKEEIYLSSWNKMNEPEYDEK